MYFNIRSLIPIICTLLLVACGSSESDSNDSGGLGKLSFTELPSFAQANENESVVLSLDVKGKDAKKLSFEWEVQFQGSDISFNGQDTDTISFTAPEVTGRGIVSVNVSFDLPDGTLLGDNRDFTSVSIIDLDPQVSQALLGSQTSLSEVSALSFDSIVNQSTWRLLHFQTGIIDLDGVDSRLNISSQRIAYIDRNNAENLTEQFCALDILQVLEINNYGDFVSCSIGSPELKLYQGTDAFRMEVSCLNEVVLASEYTKLSDTKRSDFGSLSLDFEFRDDINLTTDVCGSAAATQLISPATGSNQAELTTSAMYLVGEYMSEPLSVLMTIEGPVEPGFSHFSDVIDPFDINSLLIESNVLPALDGLKIHEDGYITLSSRSITEIDGGFNADFVDLVGAAESIEGEFELNFE